MRGADAYIAGEEVEYDIADKVEVDDKVEDGMSDGPFLYERDPIRQHRREVDNQNNRERVPQRPEPRPWRDKEPRPYPRKKAADGTAGAIVIAATCFWSRYALADSAALCRRFRARVRACTHTQHSGVSVRESDGLAHSADRECTVVTERRGACCVFV